MLPAEPSRPLGDLVFDDPDGQPMQLADLSGKTLLVNLWATWCAPCRHEMPALDQLQREMGSDTFEVVAINVETGDDVKPKAFLDEIGVDFARLLPRRYGRALQRAEAPQTWRSACPSRC